MNRVDKSLKTFVGLKRLSADLENVVRNDVSKYKLNVNEFAVLELLYHKGPKTIQKIKETILVASSSTTYIIDKLSEKKLVFRYTDSNDKRIFYVELTDEGKKLMREVFPKHADVINDYFSCLDEEELSKFHELIKKITRYKSKN
ncbi:MarR family winged helix-turn-helix transcriptional regulator [Gemelliphila palaticanis]|uniref:MarR family transcriptional regulator n=1 Tax=Gemelliphila palaticanis TaxID=81950 RepID=A0ABX2T222_9BACL|nr:MarR family transcriptional regulator [Gemella palaticanis]MBF0715574.1 MarR family transcriptional regulator [Gemella palaticanis]NYS47504.1 MarR family transcriptional regulator [Gemella palaticanis]